MGNYDYKSEAQIGVNSSRVMVSWKCRNCDKEAFHANIDLNSLPGGKESMLNNADGQIGRAVQWQASGMFGRIFYNLTRPLRRYLPSFLFRRARSAAQRGASNTIRANMLSKEQKEAAIEQAWEQAQESNTLEINDEGIRCNNCGMKAE
ncbi:MAG: hypothetical protein ACLFR1_09380 [Spirochaetia bacterium]